MDQDVYNLKGMEKALARVSYAGAALGGAAAMLTLWIVAARQARAVTELDAVLHFFNYGGFAAIPALAAVSLALWRIHPFAGHTRVTGAAAAFSCGSGACARRGRRLRPAPGAAAGPYAVGHILDCRTGALRCERGHL